MPFGWVNLDQIAVSHPREIRAVDGSAHFTTSAKRIAVSGLTSPTIEILRLDGDDVARISRRQTVLQADGTYTIAFAGSGATASYAVTQIDSLPQVDVTAARTPHDLLSGRADLLIIAHSTFSGHLGDLVAAREAQGLDVKVVEVEDLYAAYTGEVFDPAAISAYIADAAHVFGDPAVLLVGADSYDYRDYLGTGSISFVPTLYGDVGVGDIPWSPIDPAFVDLDDDQVPDLALGRLPVRNLDELAAAIHKAINYTPDTTAIFTAEEGFGGVADEIAASLPADYGVTTAYLDDLDVTAARSALLGGIERRCGPHGVLRSLVDRSVGVAGPPHDRRRCGHDQCRRSDRRGAVRLLEHLLLGADPAEPRHCSVDLCGRCRSRAGCDHPHEQRSMTRCTVR